MNQRYVTHGSYGWNPLYAAAMILLLDGHTSMDFWRSIYPQYRSPNRYADVPSGEPCAVSATDAWHMAPTWLTSEYIERGPGTLGLLASGSNAVRRHTLKHVVRPWKGDFPPRSFCALENGVYVSSPCFTFLQMARVIDVVELVAYGSELCGLYAFDRDDARGMRQRICPLTTKEELSAFLDEAQDSPGYKQARRALPFILERSASPMETLDVLLMCLPYRFGGYSIRAASMNCEVRLSREVARLTHDVKCYTDISWPPLKYDIEYQGRYDHLSVKDYEADRARVNALRLMGYEVIELTHGQVADWRAFEAIALHTAQIVGHYVPRAKRGLYDTRRMLRRMLFAWNRCYGHPTCKE